ncbi:hypothetical protein [Falsihalocynthiibacter arcticus]|uniref:hypothetical protein n=1 Tax=Falsihalocynthiibacter arcticus TaxID=1579316 RepID=UPI0030026EA8
MRMITEATPPPLRVRGCLGVAQTHFGKRAGERGIVSIPGDALRVAVEWAARQGRAEFLEPVFEIRGANFELMRVMRFRAPEGVFFALISVEGVPVTLYDRAIMRKVRAKRRWQRKHARGTCAPPL